MEYKKIGFSEDDIEQITSELANSQLTIKVALKSGTTLSTAPITLSSKDTKPTSVSANIANNKLTITVALSDGTQISSIPVVIVKPTSVTTEYSNKTLAVKLGLSDGTTLQDTAAITDIQTIETELSSLDSRLGSVEQAVDTKLDKVETTSDNQRVYGITPEGGQNTLIASSEVVDSALVLRDSSGGINVPTPNEDSNSTNKLYTDSTFAALLELSMDSSTFVVTATLKNLKGETLGSPQTIDLPLESVVVNASYDSANKKIVLTLQNGNTIDVPVSDLVSGLASSADLNALEEKALVKPNSAPTSKSIVIVDTNNNQQLITLGANISISGTTLSSKDTKPTAISTNYADGSLTTQITLSDGNVLQDSVIIDQNHYVESTESLTEATTWVSGNVLTEFAEQVYQGISEAALKDGVVVINGAQHTIIVSDFTAGNMNDGISPHPDISFIVGRKLCVLQWSFVTDTGEWAPTFSALEHNSFTVTENADGTVDLTIE